MEPHLGGRIPNLQPDGHGAFLARVNSRGAEAEFNANRGHALVVKRAVGEMKHRAWFVDAWERGTNETRNTNSETCMKGWCAMKAAVSQ